MATAFSHLTYLLSSLFFGFLGSLLSLSPIFGFHPASLLPPPPPPSFFPFPPFCLFGVSFSPPPPPFLLFCFFSPRPCFVGCFSFVAFLLSLFFVLPSCLRVALLFSSPPPCCVLFSFFSLMSFCCFDFPPLFAGALGPAGSC